MNKILNPSLENCENDDKKFETGQAMTQIYTELVNSCKDNNLDEDAFVEKINASIQNIN